LIISNNFHAGGLWKNLLEDGEIWGAVGCHPKSATDFSERTLEALQTMMRHRRVMAVGEIGLDYSGT
jgi:TatD DNase family protein